MKDGLESRFVERKRGPGNVDTHSRTLCTKESVNIKKVLTMMDSLNDLTKEV